MATALKLPFEYNFDDYHEAPVYADFLSNVLDKSIGCVELGDEFGGHAKNEAHQQCAPYRFRFDMAENICDEDGYRSNVLDDEDEDE